MDGVLYVTLIALLTYSLIGEVPAEIQILDPADFLDPLTDQLVMGYSNILLPIAGIRRTKTVTSKENTGNDQCKKSQGYIRLLGKRFNVKQKSSK